MDTDHSIQIRRAKPDEAPELTGIAIRAKQSNGYDDSFIEACKDELTVSATHIDHGEYWVAEQDTLCGFASLVIGEESLVGELHSFFINPEWQRRGIGKRLWLRIRRSAISQGVGKIQLDSDPSAVAFYESIGFKTVASVPSGSIEGRFIPRMETHLSRCAQAMGS